MIGSVALPWGWVWVRIDEVSNVGTGATPLKGNPKYYESGTISWVTSGLLNELFITKVEEKITELAVKETNAKVFPKHTLLVAMYGEGKTRGKVSELLVEAATNQACAALVFDGEASKLRPFVKLFLQKNYNDIRRLSSGGVQPNLNLGIIKATKVPVPPLNEQCRIVAKIEALKARSQRVKEELEAIAPLLDQFRQSVLAAAFRGDLTTDWREKNPDVEPASVLLERIRAERRRRWEEAELEKMKAQGKTPKDDQWKEKYKKPESVDDSQLPELPDGWCWVTADECTSLITDGEHATPERSDEGVHLLSARNVLNGKLSFEKVDFVPEYVYQKLEKRLKLEAGDVLLSCSGTVGRSCVAPPALRCAFVRSVAILKPLFEMGEYLSLAIRSPYLQAQIEKKKTQTAQSNIFQGRIKTLAIPVAPLDEQKVIVRAIAQSFRMIENVEQVVEDAKNRETNLDQSILAKAFRGELVPQDPNDEPASVLLERIRAEREKLDIRKKAKGKTEKKSRKAKPEAAEPKQLSLPGFE